MPNHGYGPTRRIKNFLRRIKSHASVALTTHDEPELLSKYSSLRITMWCLYWQHVWTDIHSRVGKLIELIASELESELDRSLVTWIVQINSTA